MLKKNNKYNISGGIYMKMIKIIRSVLITAAAIITLGCQAAVESSQGNFNYKSESYDGWWLPYNEEVENQIGYDVIMPEGHAIYIKGDKVEFYRLEAATECFNDICLYITKDTHMTGYDKNFYIESGIDSYEKSDNGISGYAFKEEDYYLTLISKDFNTGYLCESPTVGQCSKSKAVQMKRRNLVFADIDEKKIHDDFDEDTVTVNKMAKYKGQTIYILKDE